MEDLQKYSARHWLWILINSVLVVVILTGLVLSATLVRQSNAVTPSRTITVSAEGKASIAPDIATLVFSVVSQGATAEAVQKANTDKINLAIDYLKKQNVAAKDIQTSNYSLYPRYKYEEKTGESSIFGYELTQTVTVKVRDLEKAGAIVGGLAGAGVNQISSFSYSVEDPEAPRNDARAEAFSTAFQKAKTMADQVGVRIARVVTFSESTGGYPGPFYYDRAVMMESKGGGNAPSFEPGEEEIVVNVSVTYEIR
ncbi:MAG: SIMPL domain-containing protein [bacterium]|nr:SIMPL domain-containing protein [bacterium]